MKSIFIARFTGFPIIQDIHTIIYGEIRHREGLRSFKIKTIKLIKAAGCKAGIAIKPPTPLESIDSRIFKECDFLMPMTVNPGASGQPLMEEVLHKIARLKVMLYKMKLEKELEGDGGINASTAAWVGRLGVTVLVSGAGIFHSKDAKHAIMQLRKAAGQVK